MWVHGETGSQIKLSWVSEREHRLGEYIKRLEQTIVRIALANTRCNEILEKGKEENDELREKLKDIQAERLELKEIIEKMGKKKKNK